MIKFINMILRFFGAKFKINKVFKSFDWIGGTYILPMDSFKDKLVDSNGKEFYWQPTNEAERYLLIRVINLGACNLKYN